MEYATEKWGGRPHYRGPVVHLGDDEYGSWLWGRKGRDFHRGDQCLGPTEQDALVLIPRDDWWCLAWWVDHPVVRLYVNINTPAVWTDGRVVATDLDLDVIRFCDGRVEIVDQDEFEMHRTLYGYPPDVIDGAETAAARAYELTLAGEPPFDGIAAATWIDRGRTESRETRI